MITSYNNNVSLQTTNSLPLVAQAKRGGVRSSLKIYDLQGREVTTIFSEEIPAGQYTRKWNAANISGGIYYYRLQAGSFTGTKKLILLP